MRKYTSPKKDAVVLCAKIVGTGFSNAAGLIYQKHWPAVPSQFLVLWNTREEARSKARIERPALKAAKNRIRCAADWAKKTAEEKAARSRSNRAQAKARGAAWLKYSYDERPERILAKRHRQRLRNMLAGKYWGRTTPNEFLGCTISFFKQYIAARFKDGMTWENIGEWELDHVIPCNAFDLSKHEQVLKCFHYTNYRPEWEFRNRSRGCKPDEVQTEMPMLAKG